MRYIRTLFEERHRRIQDDYTLLPMSVAKLTTRACRYLRNGWKLSQKKFNYWVVCCYIMLTLQHGCFKLSKRLCWLRQNRRVDPRIKYNGVHAETKQQTLKTSQDA